MKHSGSADLKLMGGSIPPWLFNRMVQLSRPIVEAIILQSSRQTFLSRLSDPFWFQSFGAVIGMDWNSSGVTTAVWNALKKSINPHSADLGLYICGGKGKDSLLTPGELLQVGEKTGLDGDLLARNSKLTAKVDNTALQDGFQLYLHGFIVSVEGDWSVVQQGMKPEDGAARRYHWHSANIRSFVETPHTAICGESQGEILNLVAVEARPARSAILNIVHEKSDKILHDIRHLKMPGYADIQAKDVDIKRLSAILLLAQETQTHDFEELLLLKGLGPRTLQSLALVSEVIHGAPSRFNDPARFSFAMGGKSGRPFPVPVKVYDETISTLTSAVEKARIADRDKLEAVKKLAALAQKTEQTLVDHPDFETIVEKERQNSAQHGGRTVHKN